MGAPRACAVSNGTAALHLALLAVGVGPGDEVVTASHSFVATANSIRHCGAIPVFVDVQPSTYNLDPGLVERALGPRTKAILCVHQLGMPCDLEAILSLGRRRGLRVLEDAACALGSEILWGKAWEAIGKPHGDVACFSFSSAKGDHHRRGGHGRHGKRGMGCPGACSEEPGCERAVRGQARSQPGRFRVLPRARVQPPHDRPPGGRRARAVEAAPRHSRETTSPGQALSGAPPSGVEGIELPEEPAWARSNWQSFCVGLPAGSDQRAVMQAMLDAGVATRRGVMCAHREPAYRIEPWSCGAGPGGCGCAPGECSRLRESEAAQDRGLSLPLYHEMTEADQDVVVAALVRACASPVRGASAAREPA